MLLSCVGAAGRCMEVRNLCKDFDTPDGVKHAVAGLNLAMFEGQITCLLGCVGGPVFGGPICASSCPQIVPWASHPCARLWSSVPASLTSLAATSVRLFASKFVVPGVWLLLCFCVVFTFADTTVLESRRRSRCLPVSCPLLPAAAGFRACVHLHISYNEPVPPPPLVFARTRLAAPFLRSRPCARL